jgi:alkylation response protein AidB-like acyl-CoA dehydrogenase
VRLAECAPAVSEAAIDLALSQDQSDVVELFAQLCARECSPGVVRAAEPLGFSRDLWRSLAAVDAPGIAVTAAADGGGLGFFAAALAAEVLGRALAPVPFAEHLVATRLLARIGLENARRDGSLEHGGGGSLGSLVSGDAIATLALRPTQEGIARAAPAGAVANSVVVLSEGRLLRIDSEPPGKALPNLASSPLADRAVEARRGVRVHAIADGDRAQIAFARARAEWCALTAASLAGLAEGAFALGLAYAKERHQFGVPIGSFQALQHQLADVAVGIEGARLLARKAAWAIEASDAERDADARSLDAPHPSGERDAQRLALMALVFAAEVAQNCAYRSVHIHGGNGVSEEYDIQLYYRRAKGWPLLAGSPGAMIADLAGAMYGRVRTPQPRGAS